MINYLNNYKVNIHKGGLGDHLNEISYWTSNIKSLKSECTIFLRVDFSKTATKNEFEDQTRQMVENKCIAEILEIEKHTRSPLLRFCYCIFNLKESYNKLNICFIDFIDGEKKYPTTTILVANTNTILYIKEKPIEDTKYKHIWETAEKIRLGNYDNVIKLNMKTTPYRKLLFKKTNTNNRTFTGWGNFKNYDILRRADIDFMEKENKDEGDFLKVMYFIGGNAFFPHLLKSFYSTPENIIVDALKNKCKDNYKYVTNTYKQGISLVEKINMILGSKYVFGAEGGLMHVALYSNIPFILVLPNLISSYPYSIRDAIKHVVINCLSGMFFRFTNPHKLYFIQESSLVKDFDYWIDKIEEKINNDLVIDNDIIYKNWHHSVIEPIENYIKYNKLLTYCLNTAWLNAQHYSLQPKQKKSLFVDAHSYCP